MTRTVSEETEALRAVVREAHECIKDLRIATREARKLLDDVTEVNARTVEEIMAEAVEVGLASYSTAIHTAIENATDAVYKRFDQVAGILLGERQARGDWDGPDLVSLAQAMATLRDMKDGESIEIDGSAMTPKARQALIWLTQDR